MKKIDEVKYGTYSTTIGKVRIGYRSDKIVSISILYGENDVNLYKNEKSRISDEMHKQLEEYLKGDRKYFDIEYEIEGTDFQKKVWLELLNISYGDTISYKDLAEKIENPKACRAVGNANNKNKLPILIPCHRVIGSDKNLVGYALGLNLKKYLIDLESGNR